MFTKASALLGRVAVFAALVALGVAGRLLPHAPNCTPVAAAALFAGFYFRSRVWAVAVPVLTMVVSDLFLDSNALGVTLAVAASLLFPVACRVWLKGECSAARVGLCAVGSSAVFFLVTNGAVWALGDHDYAMTMSGLLACYAAGLEFLGYTLAGDVGWSFGLFGAYALALRLRALADAPRPVPEPA